MLCGIMALAGVGTSLAATATPTDCPNYDRARVEITDGRAEVSSSKISTWTFNAKVRIIGNDLKWTEAHAVIADTFSGEVDMLKAWDTASTDVRNLLINVPGHKEGSTCVYESANQNTILHIFP